jgi:hypothetical protein
MSCLGMLTKVAVEIVYHKRFWGTMSQELLANLMFLSTLVEGKASE